MINETLGSGPANTVDFQAIFESMPGSFIVLHPNAPHYTIIAITADMLSAIGRKQEDTIGKSIFDLYPESSEAITTPSPSHLRVSLQNAIKFKKPDQMPVARQEVANAEGILEVRYWSRSNKPVLDKTGNVLYIIHATHKVTNQINAQQQIRAIIASSHHPIGVYLGKELRIQYANQALMDGLGKGNHIIGKRYKDVLPELENQGIFQKLDQVLATGIAYHAENERIDLVVNGKLKSYYFNFSFSPLLNSAGQVYGVINTGADITDLNEARQKIEESESRFRNMVEQAPVAIALTKGYDTVIENINAPMLRLMGKTAKAEVVGKKMLQVLPEMESQQVLATVQRVFLTGQAFRGSEVEVYLQTYNSFEQMYLDLSYTPLREEGQITGVLHVAIDVTEQVLARKKIESREEELKRFKFMADQAQDPFILMREDGTFAYLNKKALAVWGYTEEEARPIRVPDVDPVYQEELFAELFARAQRQTIPQFETLHKRKDGYIYPVEVNVNGLTLEGKPHLLAVARDITERKQANAALEHKNAQLIRTNKDLDNFIYTASHDLRSPITNIEGLVYLLREELSESNFSTSRIEEVLQRIVASVNRFIHTIADLTEISRLQQDFSQNPGEEIINLPEVYQHIRVDLEYLPELGACTMQTDFQVQQLGFSRKNFRSILYNLISNAVKYHSAERNCLIQIHTWREDAYVVLSVKDNGLGMSERQQEQLYTMFKCFHDHVEGSGVGLYMVKRIVENAGGKIEVVSHLGVGTEFKVYFPSGKA